MAFDINDTSPRDQYTATAGQTVFTISFEFLEDADLNIYQTAEGVDPDDVTDILVLATDYTVVGAGVTVGAGTLEITLVSGATLNDVITIVRDAPIDRDTAFLTNGDLTIESMNRELNKIILLMQQIEMNQEQRSFMLRASTKVNSGSNLYPVPEAGKYLAWSAAENSLVNVSDAIPTAVITDAFTVDSIADLRLSSATTANEQAFVAGYYTPGDSGGGVFYWDSTSTAADNNGTIIKVTAVTAGRWIRMHGGEIDPRWFGAKGDGVTDDTAAVQASDTLDDGFVKFAKGNYVITSNVTFSRNVEFNADAILVVSTGVVVDFDNGISAPVSQIFNLAGTASVTFNLNFQRVGFPEWWGTSDDVSISKCFVACTVTQLQAKDYSLAATLKLDTPGHELHGAGAQYNGVTNDSTRLIPADGSMNGVQMGPDSIPATINDYTRGMVIKDLQISRGATPVIASDCIGLLSKFTLYQRIENVKVVEAMRGFEYIGTVAIHTDYCWSFRSAAGAGAGTDYWYGYYINGNTTIPASGGNASLYIENCNADRSGGAVGGATGVYIDNKWADTFITHQECTGCDTGIGVIGNSSAVLGYGETDLHITKPIIDAYTFAGIHLKDTSIYGAIQINGGFIAAAVGSTATASIYVDTCEAATSILGVQHILAPATSITAGLLISNSNNVTSMGCSYVESPSYPVLLTIATNCNISDKSMNNSKTASAAMQLTATTRSKFEMSCSGAAAKVTIGYQGIGTANDYNEFNCTGIDTNCISTSSANKLVLNSAQITAVGLSGTNMVSGVMA